jgi:hypothetical protein
MHRFGVIAFEAPPREHRAIGIEENDPASRRPD